jgi:dCMP deaminase
MNLAEHISAWSKDPSTQIGAVITSSDRQILSIGYNGFPRGFYDDGRLFDREKKLLCTVHAEMNAIYNAGKNGISLNDACIYVYGLPICHSCSLGVIQSGITRVVVCEKFINNERWRESWEISKQNFNEAGVEIEII